MSTVTVYTRTGEAVDVSDRYQYAALRTSVSVKTGRRSTILSKQSNYLKTLREHITRELAKGEPTGLDLEWTIVDVATSRTLERF